MVSFLCACIRYIMYVYILQIHLHLHPKNGIRIKVHAISELVCKCSQSAPVK